MVINTCHHCNLDDTTPTPYIHFPHQHHRPELLPASETTPHWQHLDEKFALQLNETFGLPSDSEGHLLASFCRLWEDVLEKHRYPFLVMKVADMRMQLGSESTALALYEELQGCSGDEQFDRWVEDLRFSVLKKANELLTLYKTNAADNFSPTHRWVPTASDPFPTCSVNLERLGELTRLWKYIEHGDTDWQGRFKNTICLETNYLEGTFRFDNKDHEILATEGFYDTSRLSKIKLGPLAGGAVRNLKDAVAILRDTHLALNEIYTFLGPDPPELTVDYVCRIHKKLMKTSQVLYNESGPRGCLSYVNIGITRQASRSNVMVLSTSNGNPSAVQFCPYDEVDAELDMFCERFNEIIQMNDMDPYACAAWINHVFVTIHPFEDGNGRLSRILSSIPLVRKGFPPLNVPSMTRATYFTHLNNTRATPRIGGYEKLANFLLLSSLSSLRMVEYLCRAERRRLSNKSPSSHSDSS